MSDIAIKVENLSKQYRLGTVGTGTLSHDLNRFWAKVRGKEDPYLQVGQVNDRTTKAESDYVWALKDINFEVKKGEILGIIGKNGAGKSTLLKVLSRVTSPTTGSIKMNGRVGSLLEVGTGFHPELTGRENIFLNGAILGMRKWEIQKKLDEIVDFSGCEKYLDTPVKRYSSGMKVRLGFAVAAHLEPEILIVDEVLAVGDAEFQKKCIGKMQDISKKDGRTILFVSHNMEAVKKLCKTCLLINEGSIALIDEVSKCVRSYISPIEQETSTLQFLNNSLSKLKKNPYIEIERIGFGNHLEDELIFSNGETIELTIKYVIKNPLVGLRLSVKLFDENWLQIFRSTFDDGLDLPFKFDEGKYESILKIPKDLLSDRSYFFHIYPWVYRGESIHHDPIVIKISIKRKGKVNKAYPGDPLQGVISPLLEWKTVKY